MAHSVKFTQLQVVPLGATDLCHSLIYSDAAYAIIVFTFVYFAFSLTEMKAFIWQAFIWIDDILKDR